MLKRFQLTSVKPRGIAVGSCVTWEQTLQRWVKDSRALLPIFFHQPLEVRTPELASDGRHLIPLAKVLLEDASALQK